VSRDMREVRIGNLWDGCGSRKQLREEGELRRDG